MAPVLSYFDNLEDTLAGCCMVFSRVYWCGLERYNFGKVTSAAAGRTPLQRWWSKTGTRQPYVIVRLDIVSEFVLTSHFL